MLISRFVFVSVGIEQQVSFILAAHVLGCVCDIYAKSFLVPGLVLISTFKM